MFHANWYNTMLLQIPKKIYILLYYQKTQWILMSYNNIMILLTQLDSFREIRI